MIMDSKSAHTSAGSWREQDGVIYMQVTSDGTTGPQWIKRLLDKGYRLSQYAKDKLESPGFKPTCSVTYEIAVLKGTLFEDGDRTVKKIGADASKRNWQKPGAEVACLIREKFSDEEIRQMGLVRIIVMHEPIKDQSGALCHLHVSTHQNSSRGLYAYSIDKVENVEGLAYAVSAAAPDY